MITIKGYKQIDYHQLQIHLHSKIETCGKSLLQIAAEINVQSVNTIKNALNRDNQVAADLTLVQVMEAMGVSGLVLYNAGGKSYYIKTK